MAVDLADDDGVKSPTTPVTSSVIKQFAAPRHAVTVARGRPPIAGATAHSRHRVGRSPRADVDRDAQATKKVKEEIDQITKAKFAEPSPEEYDAAIRYSQRSDGSRTPKVPADANV